MSDSNTFKIACSNCQGHIEFPKQMHGEVISCPHCGLSTALRVPGYNETKQAQAAPPPLSQKAQAPQVVYLEQKPKTGCLTLFIAIFLLVGLVGFIIALFNDSSAPSPAPTTAPAKQKLVSCSITTGGSDLIIQNTGSEKWSGVTIIINGNPPFSGYSAVLPDFTPGEKERLPLNQFTDKDGNRFNPYQKKVLYLWIGGGGHDYEKYAF